MRLSEMLLPEFDLEMTNTRRVLERVPEEKMEWRPHIKSMTFGRLAGHVAELAAWGASIINQDSIDLTERAKKGEHGFEAQSSEDLLRQFDKNAAEAREALEKASDQHLNQNWCLYLAGKAIISMPRLQAIRISFLNHLIHHRGQLEVYLRLNNVPLPSLYGPSADEAVPSGGNNT
jgi:uncharacterized damage-inducible protein DinB